MNKRELLYGLNQVRDIYSNCGNFQSGARTGLATAITLVEQLDEPEKVVVPKFVADYIELNKGWNGDRQAYTEDNSELWFALGGDICGMPNSVSDWLFNEEKVETFARAWLDGYEVEKKKLYQVIIPKKDLVWECYYLDRDGRIYVASNSKYADSHTEEFIRSISDDLWQFAVEVAE